MSVTQSAALKTRRMDIVGVYLEGEEKRHKKQEEQLRRVDGKKKRRGNKKSQSQWRQLGAEHSGEQYSRLRAWPNVLSRSRRQGRDIAVSTGGTDVTQMSQERKILVALPYIALHM